MQQSLQDHFKKNILPALQKELKLKNTLAVPRITKVILNVGIGKLTGNGKDYSHIVDSLAAISGQKPVVAKARIAISNFKLKKGQPVGVSVTIRGRRMYDFLNKLANVTFPRVRDFRGISPRSFDGKGNYSVAIKEHTVFPEINPDDISKLHGVQVTIVTTAKSNEQGLKLLGAMGFPFQKKKSEK
jgi:large subunit ribosomal protein L5